MFPPFLVFMAVPTAKWIFLEKVAVTSATSAPVLESRPAPAGAAGQSCWEGSALGRRRARQRPPASGLGSLQALLFHDVPELAQVGLCDDVVRLELQRPQVVGLGALQPPVEVQDGPQVHQRGRILGPERARKPIKGPFQAFLPGRQKSSCTYANDSLMSGGVLWKQFSNLYKQTKITRKGGKKFSKQRGVFCTLKRARQLMRMNGLHMKT